METGISRQRMKIDQDKWITKSFLIVPGRFPESFKSFQFLAKIGKKPCAIALVFCQNSNIFRPSQNRMKLSGNLPRTMPNKFA